MIYTAYTDGSSRGGYAGWAYELDGQVDSGGMIQTNNYAEIYAIAKVMEALPYGANVVIFTDSKFAIGALSYGWKMSKPHLHNLVECYHALRGEKNIRVHFQKVKAHSDDDRNIHVDLLAFNEAGKQKNSRRDSALREDSLQYD